MASSGDAVLALKVHLSRKNYMYTKPLASLKDGKEFLLQCYPSLEVKEMEICDDEGVSRWVVVCCTYLILVEVRPVNTSHFTDLVKDSRATTTWYAGSTTSIAHGHETRSFYFIVRYKYSARSTRFYWSHMLFLLPRFIMRS